MDGAFVNTREKSSTCDSNFHENKLGVVFSSDNKRIVQKRDKEAQKRSILNGTERERYIITNKYYTAYVGSVAIFKKLMFNCAIRGGYGNYEKTVLVSDGASWIRNLKDELFYDAQQILDFYHLCEKVWDFGRLYFKVNLTNNSHNKAQDTGKTKSDDPNYCRYKEWGEQTCLKLLDSKTAKALDDIKLKEKELNLIKGKLSNALAVLLSKSFKQVCWPHSLYLQ